MRNHSWPSVGGCSNELPSRHDSRLSRTNWLSLRAGLLLAALFASAASAATVTWDGGGDGVSWQDPANWTGDKLPSETDEVVLTPAGGTTVVFVSSDVAIRRLDLCGTLLLAGGSLGVGETVQVSGTLMVAGGGFSTPGGLSVIGGALEYSSGTLGGPVTVRNGTLALGAGAISPATFVLQGNCAISGVVNPGQTLRLQSSVAYGAVMATASAGLTNKGTVRLECVSDDWRDRSVTLTISSGVLENSDTGRIEVGAANGNGRSIRGSVRNEGTIAIESGITLSIGGTEPVFAQIAGTIDAQGAFLLESGQFDWTGGALLGTVRVLDSRVAVEETVTSVSTLRLVGAANSLVRNLSVTATLWVEGNTTWGPANLIGDSGAENRGTIRLESSSNDAWDRGSRLDCGEDGIVNSAGGVIRSVRGAGDPREITGRLINRGLVDALTSTEFRGTLEAAGGSFAGALRIRNSAVLVTGSPSEPTMLDLVGEGNQLLTDNLPNTILRINGTTSHGLARLTLPQGSVNSGVLRFETTSNDVWDRGSYLDITSGTLVNAADGRIEVILNQGDGRVITGNVRNEGAIFVEPNTTLEVRGTDPKFVHASGKLDAQGAFLLQAGRFDLLGGVLDGTVRVLNSTVLVGASLTQASTLRLVGDANRLAGNLSPVATLWVEGTVAWGAARLTTEPGAENRGVIRLETSSNDVWDRGSRLDCGVAGMVNDAGAVVRTAAGSGDPRVINGRLINRGLIDAQTETEFIGTLQSAGGTYNGLFLVHDSDLEITASPPEPTTILLEGPNNRLLTCNLVNTELWVRGNPRFGSALLTAVHGLANEGTVRLETTANDYANRGSQLKVEGGLLSNAAGGIVRINAGQGGPRTILAALDNSGLVEINTSCTIGTPMMRHVNRGVIAVNSGTAAFSGLALDSQQAGRITGTGTLDVNGVKFENAGTISPGASVGTLTLAGTSRLLPSSVVEIEFAIGESGIVCDRLVFDGLAYLQGALRLERIGGALPAEGSAFPVVTHTGGYGRFDEVTGITINEALKFDLTYEPAQLLVKVVDASSSSEDAPQIVRHPANQETVRGRPAWFGVTANGATPLEFQWQFNGADIAGATQSVHRIASVAPADAGAYRVLVRNQYGSVTSNPATLTVQQSIGTFIAAREAGTTELPAVSGNGVTIDVFNGIGGGRVPDPSDLVGRDPDGTTLSPFIDFPQPGTTVAVGSSFNRFFAETTTPPEQVSGLQASNFILRTQFYLRVSRDLDLDPQTPDIDVRLGVGSDDGFHLAVGSVLIASAGDRGFAWTYRTVSFEEAGLYPVTLLFAANASGSSGLEFGWETATHGTTLAPQSALYRSLTAGQHLISFEELPAGTVISNQFASVGIVFETISGNLQITSDRPTEFVPVSPPNVYADPALVSNNPVELELRFVDTATVRAATVGFLSFHVIDAEATGALVTAFNPEGDEIFRQAYHGGGAAREDVLLSVPNIFRIRVRLGQGEDTAAIDHITFSSPEPLSQQRFELAIGDRVSPDVPGPGAGFLEFPAEEDWYTFAVVAGQKVFFDDQDSSTRRLSWELHAPGDRRLFSDRLDGNDPGAYTLAETGLHLIRVLGEDGSRDTGSYGFKLWAVPPAEEFAIAIGDTVTEGQPGPGAGRIETPGAVDRYTFTAQPGQPVFFEEFAPSMTFLWWRCVDQDGAVVLDDHFQGGDAGVKVLTRGGVYTLEVYGWGQAEHVGAYGFKLWSELPLILRSPETLTVYVGRDATFSVLAESRFPLQYQWQFNDADIPGATQPVFVRRGVGQQDAGTYTVKVSNSVGLVQSEPALLMVDSNVPDLAVVAVRGPSNGQAGQPIELVWTVTNNGVAAAIGPWTERISISADAVVGGDQTIALFAVTAPIAPTQSIVRTQQVALPCLGVAGDLWFVVQLDGDDQVPEANESNNAGISAQPTQVTPVLTLQVSKTRLTEGESTQARLTRNGDLGSPLTVALTVSPEGHLASPSTVLLPAGRESELFSVVALADGVVDGDVTVTIEASAAGYASSQTAVEVVDVDVPALTVVFASATVPEGDRAEGTLSILPPASADISVTMESSNPDQLAVPRTVIIPKGQTNATFSAVAVEDALIEPAVQCSVSASSSGIPKARAAIAVIDNDAPALELTSARSAVSESDGPLATTLAVTRTPLGTLPLTVELESSVSSKAVVSPSVPIPAGQASATFALGVVDNSVLDGNRAVEIRAFVTETLTGKRIGQPAKVAIEIIDDEAPSLALTLAHSLVPEGRAPATTGTVVRNTPTDTALTVQLRSDRPAEATVPGSVVILAGHTSAVFEIVSIDDGVADGNQTVVITAEAPGLAASHGSLIVTDVNLPDLVVNRLLTPDQGYTGASFNVTCRESNSGLAPATGSWKQRLFLSTDPYPGNDLFLGEVAFSGTVDPGLHVERTGQYRLPTTPGDYWLVVVADADNVVTESFEGNNTAVSSHPMRVTASYAASVQTDIDIAPADTPVPLRGRALRAGSSEPAPFELVNVHITVRGTRRIVAALTDAQGNFATTFYPLPGEAGRYEIGAAHPGETSAPVQDSFTLVGMRFDPPELAIDLPAQSSLTGHVTLVNLTEIPLTGITHTSSPTSPGIEIEWTLPTSLAPDARVDALYRITSFDEASLDIGLWLDAESSGGARSRLPVHLRVKPLLPRLTASPGTLVAGMVRGDQTLVTFQVQNEGGASSGPLQILLPSVRWLQLATPSPMPALNPGASHQITLQLIPPSDMPLTEYPGALLLTDGQTSLNVPFRFYALSDATGTLRVAIEDEYTFYAAGSPRVGGASVAVRDALSKQKLAEGTTDADGLVSFPALHEGFYEIEGAALDHNPNSQTLFVAAGQTTEARLFLSRHSVQYVWQVVPTQIEDRSRITIEAVFETEVPMPVITVDPPLIDLAEVVGDMAQIDLKITNHGLIAAETMQLQFDKNPRWEIKPLIQQLGTLPARSSITVPVLIRRLAGGAQLHSTPQSDSVDQAQLALPDPIDQGCAMGARLVWELLCGPNRNLYSRAIHIANVGGCCPYGGGFVPLGGGSAGGAPFLGSTVVVATDFNCHPCAEKAFEAILKCAAKFIPMKDWIKCIRDQNKCVRAYLQGGGLPSAGTAYQCAKAQLVCIKAAGVSVPGLSYLKYFECIHSLLTVCQTSRGLHLSSWRGGLHGVDPTPAWQLPPVPDTTPELQSVRVYVDRAKSVFEAEVYLLGDLGWLEVEDAGAVADWLDAFYQATDGANETDWSISGTERSQLLQRPSAALVTAELAEAFINRWNRSVAYWAAGIFRLQDVPPGQSADFIALDQWAELADAADAAADLSIADGFEDPFVGLQAMIDEALREFSQPNEGICATVRIRIDQDAVLTRDAFKASLDLINRSPIGIDGVRIDLAVQDSSGAPATERFVIQPPTLDGLSGIDGTGRVLPQSTGHAAWLIIPTPEAAPDRARVYFVVGALAYSQEGVEVRVPLAPTPITVHPSPSLFLQYFHQRDVLADDPFTDKIEPSVPYSLAVLVRNQGAGVARNFRITSAQPKIIDNEKGLLIDFEILATEVAGRNLTPSLTADFGDVQPGSTAIGRWLFRSSLQGLFIDYSARFEHIDGLGDPRLSLIDNVEMHELIRIVHAGGMFGDDLPDMLANDYPDDLDLPDTLYLSDGSVHPVSVIRNATANRLPDPENLDVQVTAIVPSGWVYLRLPDPGQGKYQLARIRRSDGTDFPIDDNAWITDRTFIGGGHRPVYEYTLHIFDHDGSGAYTLTYTLPPELDLVPPASRVAALPAASYETIPVSWSGSDNLGASGLDTFDVFAAIDGGAYTPWLTRTRLTGSLYEGAFGHTYRFYSVATDAAGNTERAPAFPDATTTVSLRNTAPKLVAPTRIVALEGLTIVVTNVASDADLPPNSFTFSLAPGAPTSATINPNTGLFRWVTTEADGPGQFQVAVRVTDNGLPPLGDEQLLSITVLETNQPPILDPIPDSAVDEGTLLQFAVSARDLDWPLNKLTFTLDPVAPAGVSLDPLSGAFTWRPSAAQGPSTNLITLRVTDDGAPPLSASRTFAVVVKDTLSDFIVLCGVTNVLAGQPGSVPLALDTIDDLRQLAFEMSISGDRLQNIQLAPVTGDIAASLQPLQGGRWRCQFDALQGHSLSGAQTIGNLLFSTAAEPLSVAVQIRTTAFEAVRTGGHVIRHGQGRDGLVFVIGEQPLLQANNEPGLPLVLYGRPDRSYEIQSNASLARGDLWLPFKQVHLYGTYAVMARPMPDKAVVFHRALEVSSKQLRLEIHKTEVGRLVLIIVAAPDRDVVLESAGGLAPSQEWRLEQRVRITHEFESVQIDPAGSVRLYRARLD